MDDCLPAFPQQDGIKRDYCGMSLRDYFAAKAMQGILAREIRLVDPNANPATDALPAIVKDAYTFADAMLKVRAK